MTEPGKFGDGGDELAIAAAHAAAYRYDERLSFKLNEDRSQWCVYIRLSNDIEWPDDHPRDIPILGFDGIPTPDQVQKRLYETDTVRHGEAIMDSVNAHNERLRNDARAKADEAAWDTTERIEKGMRGVGLSPIVKSTRNVKGAKKRIP